MQDLLLEAVWEMSLSPQGGVWLPAVSLAPWWEHSRGRRGLLLPSHLSGLSSAPQHVIAVPKPRCPLASSRSEPLAFPRLILPPPSPASSAGIPQDTHTSRAWTPVPWATSAFPSTADGGGWLPTCLPAPALPSPHPHARVPPASHPGTGARPAASHPHPPPPAFSRRFTRRLRGPDSFGWPEFSWPAASCQLAWGRHGPGPGGRLRPGRQCGHSPPSPSRPPAAQNPQIRPFFPGAG